MSRASLPPIWEEKRIWKKVVISTNVPLAGRVQDEEAGGFDFDRWDFSAPGVGVHLGFFQRHHRSVPKMFDRLFG
jgi:hypothetical protein